MPWMPGRRATQRALEEPFEDVPDHLFQPLWQWIENCLYDDDYGWQTDRITQIALDLRIPQSPDPDTQIRYFHRRAISDGGFMLDLVEQLLSRYSGDRGLPERLAHLLDTANSAYRVNAHQNGLETRVAAGVRDVVQQAVGSGGSAGDHLAQAWNAAYGRVHDPVKSYSESIKAVEAAMAQRVAPQNARQTLGTMIRDIAARPDNWEFELSDGTTNNVGTVLSTMRMLWEGQTSRHGGTGDTQAETLPEAQAAVHIAALLVQFGASGAFRARVI